MGGGIQRQWRRFQLSLPVWVRPRRTRKPAAAWASKPGRAPRASTPEPENTFTENISTAGCYFRFSREIPVGSRVEMEIEMPAPGAVQGRAKVRCWGKVVRVEHLRRGGRIGIACMIEHYRFLYQSVGHEGRSLQQAHA